MSKWRKIFSLLIAAVILIGVSFYYFRYYNRNYFDVVRARRSDQGALFPHPRVDEQGSDSSRGDVEKAIGRPFTDEEVALKPEAVPWHAWAHSIEVHKISAAKNGMVEFFGKVVSESGEPLRGVSLVAEVAGSEPSFVKALATGDETYVKTIELTTDQNGEFEITGAVGRRLIIKDFRKQGYAIFGEKKFKGDGARKSWSDSFIANSSSSFLSDPENPEVFIMKEVE